MPKPHRKILVVGNPLYQEQYSILAFQKVLVEGLLRKNWEVATSNAGQEREVGQSYLSTRFEKFFRFPASLRKISRSFPIAHICEHGCASYLRWLKSPTKTITCHDLVSVKAAFGETDYNYVSFRGKFYQSTIVRDLRKADRIVSVSQKTLEDVERIVQPAKGASLCVYNGFYREALIDNRDQAIDTLRTADLLPKRPYYVHISGPPKNKNRRGLLEIYGHLQEMLGSAVPDLWLLGSELSQEEEQGLAFVKEKSKIRFVIRPSDELVQASYTCADLLIFPSWDEGFGLPIIEAQRVGCPVATTCRPPMSEVAGDAAILIEPHDARGSAETIVQNLHRRDELIQAGLQNIQRFSLEQMIDGYDKLFSDLVLAS
ncbi:MAG: glycosyltransferase [Fimbriimonadaceae bacterium]|jgi:glycosyltransferase involved in cell wall biosynthesis|nr:glycosyltransferase [Fimbriimonadaceae bacterium]